MGYVIVFEAAHDMGDRIRLTDVGEELIAEALTFRGAGNQTGDVDELHRCRDDFRGLHDTGEHVEARIGHRHDADVRLDRAERVVLGRDLRRRQRIEECRLADVRQADDAAFDRHA